MGVVTQMIVIRWKFPTPTLSVNIAFLNSVGRFMLLNWHISFIYLLSKASHFLIYKASLWNLKLITSFLPTTPQIKLPAKGNYLKEILSSKTNRSCEPPWILNPINFVLMKTLLPFVPYSNYNSPKFSLHSNRMEWNRRNNQKGNVRSCINFEWRKKGKNLQHFGIIINLEKRWTYLFFAITNQTVQTDYAGSLLIHIYI